MKGMPGLIVAIGLGVVAVACNWIYMAKIGEQAGQLQFVGVKGPIAIGETFRPDHFTQVPIPKLHAGELDRVAVPWSARETLYGFAATRAFRGGEIVLKQDIRTRGRETAAEKIGKDEVVKWVPVDTRGFVSQQVNPGDLVAFTLPGTGTGNRNETIGPFRILFLGNRGGDVDVERAAGAAGGNESVIAIACKISSPPELDKAWDGKLETKAERLFERLRASGYQAAEISLFSSKLWEKK